MICRRFRMHQQNPWMLPAALSDMRKLAQSTRSDAVIRRVNRFINDNQPPPTVTRA